MFAPKTTPPFLYKYCSAPRAKQILSDLTLFLAPAAGQNDLYEFRARSLYRETAESKHRIFAKSLISEGWYSDFEDALSASKELNLTEVDERYEVAMGALNRTFDDIMAHSGVTCFSSDRNNQRMWGTYGDNHAGVVIEFNTDPSKSKLGAHFGPVIYTGVRPDICPSMFINNDLSWNQKLMSSMLNFKHTDWRDEKEWRLLLLADMEQAKEDRIASFERSAITRVFLGPRISSDNEAAVRDAATAHNPEIPVLKRVIDEKLAYEDLVGYEQLEEVEQLAYWFPQFKGVGNVS